MCHAFLTDANFYQLLTRIDESMAEEVRARGCDCGGALHSARYPRKPRGERGVLDESYSTRLSFCCAEDGCRRRSTPPSVRFLGRKVYLSVIIILITALNHGLTPSRRQRLTETLGVSVQTLRRWQQWWREQFVQTRCFRALAGVLIQPVITDDLPDALLGQLSGKTLSERVIQLLVLIAPSTTATGSLGG